MPPQVYIVGLKEFRKELKAVERSWGKELRQAFLRVSKYLIPKVQAAAPPRAKDAVKAKATQAAAFINTTPGRRGDGLGVFWGMRRRSGWYAAARYRESTARQFEPWVGNQWDPGETGGVPYFIGPVINAEVDNVVDLLGDEVIKLAERAFPE